MIFESAGTCISLEEGFKLLDAGAQKVAFTAPADEVHWAFAGAGFADSVKVRVPDRHDEPLQVLHMRNRADGFRV